MANSQHNLPCAHCGSKSSIQSVNLVNNTTIVPAVHISQKILHPKTDTHTNGQLQGESSDNSLRRYTKVPDIPRGKSSSTENLPLLHDTEITNATQLAPDRIDPDVDALISSLGELSLDEVTAHRQREATSENLELQETGIITSADLNDRNDGDKEPIEENLQNPDLHGCKMKKVENIRENDSNETGTNPNSNGNDKADEGINTTTEVAKNQIQTQTCFSLGAKESCFLFDNTNFRQGRNKETLSETKETRNCEFCERNSSLAEKLKQEIQEANQRVFDEKKSCQGNLANKNELIVHLTNRKEELAEQLKQVDERRKVLQEKADEEKEEMKRKILILEAKSTGELEQIAKLTEKYKDLTAVLKQVDEQRKVSQDKADKEKEEMEQKILSLEAKSTDELKKNAKLTESNKKLHGDLGSRGTKIKELVEAINSTNMLSKEREETLESKLRDMQIQTKSVLQEKDTIIKDITDRLAAEMSNKVSANEQSIENVSIKHRPMNIAAEYGALCSNQWHDAKTELDEHHHLLEEEERIKLLCKVLTVAEARTKDILRRRMDELQMILLNPVAVNGSEECDKLTRVIPDDITNLVGDFMRNGIDKVDFEPLVQNVTTDLCTIYYNQSGIIQNNQVIEAYIKQCCSLAWKMRVQRPPMTFKQDGIDEVWQGEKKQDISWNSSNPSHPATVVKYYVHPSLYHGDNLMVKGKVFLEKAQLM